MPILDYQFCVGQTVYHVDNTDGIRDAVVKKVEATIQYGSVALQYTIAYKTSSFGSAIVDQATLYALADDAWAAYKQQYLTY